MLKYQLNCEAGHSFEGWFSSSQAFDEQVSKELVSCPICGSLSVRRALMAPNLNSPKQRKEPQVSPAKEVTSSNAPVPQASADNPLANLSPKDQAAVMGAAMSALRDMHKKVKTDFTNVGQKFAEEARKMHYGEADAKPIYGTTTPEEREELSDEGIVFHELPDLPPEH